MFKGLGFRGLVFEGKGLGFRAFKVLGFRGFKGFRGSRGLEGFRILGFRGLGFSVRRFRVWPYVRPLNPRQCHTFLSCPFLAHELVEPKV